MVFPQKMGLSATGITIRADGGHAGLEFEDFAELDAVGSRLSGNACGVSQGKRGPATISDSRCLHAGFAGNLVRRAFAILSVPVRPSFHHVFLLRVLCLVGSATGVDC